MAKRKPEPTGDDTAKYSLSAEFEPAHSGDVKAVLAVDDDLLVSASRDSSVAVWKLGKERFDLVALLEGHGAYVNSLAYIPPIAEDDNRYIASGGNSGVILVHNLTTLQTTSKACLIGHALNVCALSYSSKQQKLISGSWDTTARVWSREKTQCGEGEGQGYGEWKTDVVLEGHEQAVWDVAVVEGSTERQYLTCSADRLVNLWDEGGQLLQRFKGSPEPVRSLAILPSNDTFVTACNDGLIRLWDFTGSVLQVLRGHTDYTYRVIVGTDSQLISCGEDHTARVWHEGEEIDILPHPCQTVWCVASLPNGDIATGGSDGVVRAWSRASTRIASADIQKSYRERLPVIPDRSASRAPNLTAAPEAAAPVTMTIDIDLSDEDPPIPLVYSTNVEPRVAAEEFGHAHNLSDNYINQIEAFIKAHLS
ncbi:hypothetical protein B9479_004001 [Cryptococcus floricola]|uniref:PFU domain-containing protein n=1 Tax=Cryptococcus floricola TaxID=2591691 RepID=A0A5D3AWP0_9TREE|nr:hypothetical protein B9479_004001 [Cryptococcus floricola]